MKKTMIAVLMGLLAGIGAGAMAQTPDSDSTPDLKALLVEDSYIVTFKPAAPGHPALIAPALSKQAATANVAMKIEDSANAQPKESLRAALGLQGKVVSILDSINAAHLKMDSSEAARLRAHPQVLSVEPNKRMVPNEAIQTNPGWALDRLDQSTTLLNNQYRFNANGSGQTVYVLDSGLDLTNPLVAAQFGGRASVLWDVNGQFGIDCFGHGTQVASAIGGSTHGVAKGVKLVVAKITSGCTGNSDTATMAFAFNWLAANAPRGTIVNLSYGIELRNGAGQTVCANATTAAQGISTSAALESAITAAYNAGIITVVAAGNDGCDTAYYTPTRQPQTFVVGATGTSRLSFGQDAKMSWSRTGTNISTFAPGSYVNLLHYNGQATVNSGTSFSAPYLAGIFAAGCQFYAPYCASTDVGTTYQQLRAFGTLGTVVNPDGSALTGATSRFISRSPW